MTKEQFITKCEESLSLQEAREKNLEIDFNLSEHKYTEGTGYTAIIVYKDYSIHVLQFMWSPITKTFFKNEVSLLRENIDTIMKFKDK